MLLTRGTTYITSDVRNTCYIFSGRDDVFAPDMLPFDRRHIDEVTTLDTNVLTYQNG